VGPAGPKGDTGDTGAQGPQGLPGATWISGTGAPTAATGADGDLYLDTAASEYYGPKTAGSWGTPTSLVGPQGPAGTGSVAASTIYTAGSGPIPQWSGSTSLVTVTATCDTGVMRGGGYRPSGPENGTNVTVSASYPSSGTSWTVQAWNGYDGTSSIDAYVICEPTT
jgi:hypothetical protein